jgi:ribosomal protein S18 acetylase RimI-like enzyme
MRHERMTVVRDDEGEPGSLPTDAVTVRDLRREDLAAIVRIDRASTGRPREEYYRAKVEAALCEPQLRTSLVAELEGRVVGFVVARLFYGEFGRAEAVAVIDSVGVDPEFRRRHVGQALLRQLTMNLRALRVERVETQVDWDRFELLAFLARNGFRPSARLCLEHRLD